MRKLNRNTAVQILKKNGRGLDYPALQTYAQYLPEKIKALCDKQAYEYDDFDQLILMPAWETLCPSSQLRFRLKAYWVERGAAKAKEAAMWHKWLVTDSGVDYETACKLDPQSNVIHNLQDLEKHYLPAGVPREMLNVAIVYPETQGVIKDKYNHLQPAIPDARMIIDRCPQMAMIHVLRGDVSEPYWWAVGARLKLPSPAR